jgi:hypothetical protein
MNFSSGFFVLKKIKSSLYHFFKTKNTLRAQLVRIVFAAVVSNSRSAIPFCPHQLKPYRTSKGFFLGEKVKL